MTSLSQTKSLACYGAVDSNVAQLLIYSDLTIAEGPAPEDAVAFEDVALRLNDTAGGCDRCPSHQSNND